MSQEKKITVHGEFFQTPKHHLSGHGCISCGIDKDIERKTSSKLEFIRKAKKIHFNNYDYADVEYIDSDTKIAIT